MVRRSNSYTACSVKNPIQDQIIDVNSKYSYTIKANEVFNGDIAFLTITETSKKFLPDWLSYNFSYIKTTGHSTKIEIKGSIAYIGAGRSGLQIINITDPINAFTISYVPTTGFVYGIAVQGNLAFVAAGFSGLQIINSTEPKSAYTVSYIPSLSKTFGVAIQGSIAYVSSEVGLQIINITDLLNAKTISYVETLGDSYGLAVQGSTVYMATYSGGLQIINIMDPINPHTIGYIASCYDGARDIEVKVQYPIAYVAADSCLQVINITDPINAYVLNNIPIVGSANGIEVKNSIAYVALWDKGLQIIDITDLMNPYTIGYFQITSDISTNYASGVLLHGSILYLTLWTGGLQIINLKEISILGPKNGKYIKYGDISSLTVMAIDYLGNSCISNFKIIVDQLPILNNKIVDQKFFLQQSICIQFDLNIIFTARGYLKPLIIDKKPTWLDLTLTPKLISTYNYRDSSINDIKIEGKHAYLATEAGLLIVDISNIYFLSLYNGYLTSAAKIINIASNQVFLATNNQLLQMNISNFATLISTYNYPNIIQITAMYEKIIINNGRQIFINPINNVKNYIANIGAVYGIMVKGTIAYVALGYNGLLIIDITDPINPHYINLINTSGFANAVEIQDGSSKIVDSTVI